MLAVDQDALGAGGRRVATIGAIDVIQKPLEDGGMAVGFFNRGDIPHTITVKFDRIGLGGRQLFRDLWRQTDAGVFEKELQVTVQPHDVMLYRLKPVN